MDVAAADDRTTPAFQESFTALWATGLAGGPHHPGFGSPWPAPALLRGHAAADRRPGMHGKDSALRAGAQKAQPCPTGCCATWICGRLKPCLEHAQADGPEVPVPGIRPGPMTVRLLDAKVLDRTIRSTVRSVVRGVMVKLSVVTSANEGSGSSSTASAAVAGSSTGALDAPRRSGGGASSRVRASASIMNFEAGLAWPSLPRPSSPCHQSPTRHSGSQ
ncbi:hypothetical protein ACFQMH_22890 [Streptomyces viridiviolaceus]|uniref:Uncharacterized protein n=1 Tax=Streptomyces viridiviolaceus TaxID=68282 RepID=A0ABW2E5I3_9ACTN